MLMTCGKTVIGLVREDDRRTRGMMLADGPSIRANLVISEGMAERRTKRRPRQRGWLKAGWTMASKKP